LLKNKVLEKKLKKKKNFGKENADSGRGISKWSANFCQERQLSFGSLF
jgi:hypothetical protein